MNTVLKYANNANSTVERVSQLSSLPSLPFHTPLCPPSPPLTPLTQCSPLKGVTMVECDDSLTDPVDNDAMMGLDPAPRSALELPAYYKSNKDNKFLCKAHANDGCKSCCTSTSPCHSFFRSFPLDRELMVFIVGFKKQVSLLCAFGCCLKRL